MKFMVLSRSVPGADRSPWIQQEYKMVDSLHATGFFEQIYVRGDHYGAIAIVESESEDEVRRRLATLPFSVNGCVQIEQVIAVSPRW
jgi:muconolactone delta-isomerase